MKITDLKPAGVWRFFDEITKVPRPSKKEEKIRAYLRKFAQERNLEFDEESMLLSSFFLVALDFGTR